MSRPGGLYEADLSEDVDAFLGRCAGLIETHASPFHSLAWLRAWYDTLGRSDGRRPVLVGVRRRDTGRDVALLPLCSQRVWGLRLVEFADATVVDYNLPIVSADWAPGADDPSPSPQCRAHAGELWQAVRRALEPRHDAVRLQKMPGRSLDDARPLANPLVLGMPVLDSPMFGNQVDVAGDWDAWRHSLNKRVRKEFERSWRVFTRSPDARFERITDPTQALKVFDELEALQSRRMQHLGDGYRLDRPGYRGFYRRVLTEGLADGSVVLTALRDGDRLAAAQLGVSNGQRYVALRLATGGEEWKHCSPGRLSCERTGHHLHAQGLRWMDFGIGDYFHKDIFQGTHIPLHDACESLSWRGVPWVRAWHWRQARKQARKAAEDAQSQR